MRRASFRTAQWIGWVAAVLVLAVAGCSGSQLPLGSTQTSDFVRTEAQRVGGPAVVAVYTPLELKEEPLLDQQNVPLEAAGPGTTGAVREMTFFNTREPVRTSVGQLRAFAACEGAPGPDCRPERALLFFTIQRQSFATRFRPERARTLRIEADGEALGVPPTLSHDSHSAAGRSIEELWAALPFEQFKAFAQAERVKVEIGREEEVVLSGGRLKPFRALVAATQGAAQIE